MLAVTGLGFYSWSQTPIGRASLLGLGREEYRSEVQELIGDCLESVVPGYISGDTAALMVNGDEIFRELAYDWPVPKLGPARAIRCRVVALPLKMDFWEMQATIDEAIAAIPNPLSNTHIIEIQDNAIYSENVDISFLRSTRTFTN